MYTGKLYQMIFCWKAYERMAGMVKSCLISDIGSHENYYKHVEPFYKMQRLSDEERLKNFELIPQYHFGAVHAWQYDQQGMFEMLNRLKLIKPGMYACLY